MMLTNGVQSPQHAVPCGWRSEVLVRFNYVAAAEQAYMAYRHLLEHEDTGMMPGFTVS